GRPLGWPNSAPPARGPEGAEAAPTEACAGAVGSTAEPVARTATDARRRERVNLRMPQRSAGAVQDVAAQRALRSFAAARVELPYRSSMRCNISAAPAFASGSFRLPHFGDCTHDGQPDWHRHSLMSR
ncbi:MAG: hypothetical protein JWP53_3748, partial [Conexibacter sp.]|nr:hypothetical protein [Conexibacter sp.]